MKTANKTQKKTDSKATLNDCAKQVTKIHSGIETAERTVIKIGKDNIRAAIEAGKWLVKAKSLVKHGEWLPWVKKNLEGISHPTVNRYMALAAFADSPNGKELKDCQGLREAYAASGIIKDEDAKKEDDEKENAAADERKPKEKKTTLQRIKEHRRKLQNLFMGLEDNKDAINELAPLVTLHQGYYQRLKAKEESAQRDKEFDAAVNAVDVALAA